MNINYDAVGSAAVNPPLSSKIEDITEQLRDLRQLVTEFHDRLVGAQPVPPMSGGDKINPMPAAQIDSLMIRLNGAEYNINEIRGMIRNIGGRI